jgi:cell division GTPase FtsZ
VVVVGLGGVTGSTIIGPLLEQLTEVSTVDVVATLPLKFEGRRRERRAAEALAAIHWSDASLSIADLEMAKDETRPVGSYGDFLRRMDRRLAGEVVRAVAERSRHSLLKPDEREAGFGG